MSVVTALSLLLFVGFVATGLVGFLGWRQRMRGAGCGIHKRWTLSRPTRQLDAEAVRPRGAHLWRLP